MCVCVSERSRLTDPIRQVTPEILQELVTGAPTLRSGSREESLSRSESPASLVRGSPSLSCSPVLDAERGDPSVRSARGGAPGVSSLTTHSHLLTSSFLRVRCMGDAFAVWPGGRVPQFLLDGDIEAIGPVESREGDSEWSPRKSKSSRGADVWGCVWELSLPTCRRPRAVPDIFV